MNKIATRLELRRRLSARGINTSHITRVDEEMCNMMDEMEDRIEAKFKRITARFSRYEPKRKESV